MKVNKVKVKNFRALRNITLNLEEELSTIIWKNNSWKTSILSVIDKFLNKKEFSFDDLNIQEQGNILTSISSDEINWEDYSAHGIFLDIYIWYDLNDDLTNISRWMISLNPTKNEVIINFWYSINYDNILSLKDDFNSFKSTYSCDDFHKFMTQNWKKYFTRNINVVDIDDEENRYEVEHKYIRKILNFQVISAKRDVSNEESDDTLSKLSHRYFEKSDDPWETHRVDLKKAIIKADGELSWIYWVTFQKITDSIKTLSWNKIKISIQSTLDELNILKQNTSVVYENWTTYLPEAFNWLGYMNFLALIFQIHTICELFKTWERADINILFIEEPEAHTHPQMQYVFIQNIKELLKQERTEEWNELNNLQTIITTHSPHIASKSQFSDIKYFLNNNWEVFVKDLSELENEYWSDPEWILNFRFLKQYLTIHKAELFFADKAIFVEWDTERILLPRIMEKIDLLNSSILWYIPLLSQNISIVDVWTNSKTFEKFIDFLGIKTLIITDIDSVDNTRKKCLVSLWSDTSNSSIKFFLEWKDFNTLKTMDEEEKKLLKKEEWSWTKKWQKDENWSLYIVYQIEENWYHGRSFEDAFLSVNITKINSKKDSFKNSLKNASKINNTSTNYFELAENCIDKKSNFAIDLLLYDDEMWGWEIPLYIKKGLEWL